MREPDEQDDSQRWQDTVYVARCFFAAAIVAIILCWCLLGCASRRPAAVVPEDDELTDPTPTRADLNQATREAIAQLCAHHAHYPACSKVSK
jgi:hypothetical protein